MSEPTDQAETNPLPEGDYAIAECLGHRTMIGRFAEVERFGTKMLALEPIWQGGLLPAVFIGGASLYAFTPCSRDTAWKRRPRHPYELPDSLRATLTPAQLPPPGRSIYEQMRDEPEDETQEPSF